MSNLKRTRVANAIRQLLLDGHYRPGELVSESIVREHLRQKRNLAVSRQPVRHAFVELKNEGLIEIIPRVGVKIRMLDDQKLREIWDNRAILEEFIVCQLANRRKLDLTAAKKANLLLERVAKVCLLRAPTLEQQKEFVRLDIKFHDELAKQAGYTTLADELHSLRSKLHQVVFPNLYSDRGRMSEVVREHSEILKAIKPDEEKDRIRADVNCVRMAIRNHLRNSARRWRIEQRIKYPDGVLEKDYIFDLPDLGSTETAGDSVPLAIMLAMRVSMELASFLELAARPGVSLQTLENMNIEMDTIARSCKASECTSPEKARFINLDIGFHVTPPFLAGLLFAEDGIIHVWKRLYRHAEQRLTPARMKEVVAEHDKILQELKRGRGGQSNRIGVANAVKEHLRMAFKRNRFQDFDDSAFQKAVDILLRCGPGSGP